MLPRLTNSTAERKLVCSLKMLIETNYHWLGASMDYKKEEENGCSTQAKCTCYLKGAFLWRFKERSFLACLHPQGQGQPLLKIQGFSFCVLSPPPPPSRSLPTSGPRISFYFDTKSFSLQKKLSKYFRSLSE